MHTTNYSAALLVVVLMALLASPALDPITKFMFGDRRRIRFTWASFWADQTGVVVVTYCWPGGAAGNTLVAPTAAAASQHTTQTVKVAMADTDTAAIIVHNWGLPASYPTFLFPICTYQQDTIGVGPSTDLPTLTFDLTNTNQVTITKLNAVGSGGTFRVYLAKPHTLIL